MKKLVLILAGALFMLSVNAQKCLTDQMLEARFQQQPELRDVMHREMSAMAEAEIAKGFNRGSEPMKTIPVVVHVMHSDGMGNISDEQIKDAIEALNIDMNRLNADTSSTRAIFKPHAASADVQFKLAKLDPNGDCTNGITRNNVGDNSYEARDGIKRTSTGGIDAWPTNKYFNIWVVNSIEGSGEGTTLGYAQFPFGWGGGINETYGIVIRNDYMGTIGTSNNDGRTLTHEVGHCLGLFHTFQGGCTLGCSNGGDYVCDTPPAKEATYGCNINQNTCNDPNNDPYPGSSVVDQIENYMSYDACTNMFSVGQKTRMRDVLDGANGQIPAMLNLTSASNLAATGVNLPDMPCKVDFYTEQRNSCINTPIQLNDFSYSNVTSWNWSFPGGQPATSNDRNPVVSYATPGQYDVSLTISDGNGNSVDSTYQNYITVTSDDILVGPYSEGWEQTNQIANYNWTVVNPDEDNVKWLIRTNVGYNSNQSLYINNYYSQEDDREDQIISEAFDLSDLSDAVFSFNQSYAVKTGSDIDKLKIDISKDCGHTWYNVYSKSGFGIGFNGQSNSSYAPADDTKWTQKQFDIPAEYLTSNIKFRITFVAGGGNNLYMDDISISSPSGITNTLSSLSNLTVFPNPFNQSAKIIIDSKQNSSARISVLNMIGKEIILNENVHISVGNNEIEINRANMEAGVYMVKVTLENGDNLMEKIIIK